METPISFLSAAITALETNNINEALRLIRVTETRLELMSGQQQLPEPLMITAARRITEVVTEHFGLDRDLCELDAHRRGDDLGQYEAEPVVQGNRRYITLRCVTCNRCSGLRLVKQAKAGGS